MDILKNKFGSKFKFNSTLQTDASPVRPRVNPEPAPSPTPAPHTESVKIEDVTDTDTFGEDTPPIITDPPESPLIPPDSPPIPPLRRKAKKKSFQSENSNPGEEKPVPPINTHASGSVINIVNSNGIHWGPEITYNFGSQTKVDPEPDPDAAIRKTKSIVVVLESKDSVQHEHMDLVSKNLGAGWRSVARRMGYEDGMLDLLYESHQHKGVPEVIYQVLLDWTRTGERTLGELCTGLWKDGKRAVVRDIANLHKDSPPTKPGPKKFDLD